MQLKRPQGAAAGPIYIPLSGNYIFPISLTALTE